MQVFRVFQSPLGMFCTDDEKTLLTKKRSFKALWACSVPEIKQSEEVNKICFKALWACSVPNNFNATNIGHMSFKALWACSVQ